MRRSRFKSGMALALAGMVAFQSVNWSIAVSAYSDTTNSRTINQSDEKTTYYFVDCGDYVPDTVNSADMYADDTRDDNDVMGIYQSVTDQAYGRDAVTGKYWGIVAEPDPSQADYTGGYGVRLLNAWAFEFNAGNADAHRNWSNTYSKDDPTPSLTWKFELPQGEYDVEACFVNPWGNCSGVKLVGNGTTIGTIDTITQTTGVGELDTKYGGATVNGTVTVGEDGVLTLDATATGLCLNCGWIKITGDSEEKMAIAALDKSKVLQLSFEENLTDGTGNHTIEASKTVAYENGVNGGKAINLDGATYLTLGTAGDLQPQDLTVSFWVKRDAEIGDEEMIMWCKGEYNNNGWYIGVPNKWQHTEAIILSIGPSSGQPLEFYVNMTRDEFFGDNEWVHVVATFDNDTQQAEIYRNGTKVAVTGYNSTTGSVIVADDCVKSISSNGGVYGHGANTKLNLDEFEVFKTTVTKEQAELLYTKNGGVIEKDAEDENDDDKEYIGGLSAYDLWDVDVTDSYLTNAEDKDIAYLLSLNSDKLLAGFRETAGLDMKGATRYDGWENTLIGGHTMGHYLTAMAQAVASLPNTDARKTQLADKLNGIIAGLKECQDALGTGYIFGATLISRSNVELQFDNVEKGLVNIGNQAWVPWYTMHKILAGLIDTYKYTGNETALEIAKNLGDWVYDRATGWSAATRNTVLGIEYGGMNDCLYELYAVTGEDKYAVAAHIFDEDTLFENVNEGIKNILNGKHANTTIPKFIGALNRYVTTNGKTINGEAVDSTKYLEYAESFFDMVLENHTYITGDNSEWEHFGADNILDAERTNCNCETCNAYNMMKFAKALYMVTGDEKYTDYYETAFYNTILSSQNPSTGMTTYFQPMKSGYFKVYGTETKSFWCCTGSGMENFTKLGNAIYYYNDDMIIVNQYLSSVLNDTDKGVKLTQTADIPNSDTVKFNVTTTGGQTKLALRLPDWLADDAEIKVNGVEYSATIESGYAIVDNVINGTEITIKLPMEIKAYNLPDGENVYAFKYGPIVLSAKLGSTNMTQTTTGVSVSIPSTQLIEEEYISDGSETISVINGTVADFIANINENLVKTEGKLEWTLENTDANLVFVPHYSQHTERYGIYFNYVSNTGAFNAAKYIRDKAQSRFNAALTDTVQPAYGQYENDELHEMVDNGSTPNVAETTRYANANGSFTYTMKIAEGTDNCIQTTFDKADNGKTIKITVGSKVVYEKTLNYTGDEDKYTVRIPVVADIIEAMAYNKTVEGNTVKVVDVKFESADSNDSARVCNFVYMTKAYSKDTSLDLTAKNATVVKESNTFNIKVAKDVTELELTAALATAYGYIRVNGNVVRTEVPYKVDLSSSNFAELEITVYAEDHETTETYTVRVEKEADLENRKDVDKTLAYFVNCGDYDVTTLSKGDLFGIYNGVTDNAYGIDPITGYKWGVVDTVSNPLKNGTVTNNPAMTNAVFTDNTWAFETNSSLNDESAKTLTNRYTKNQYESGMDRNLKYAFELPNGKYSVEMYFADPWGCSKNPVITAEGKEVVTNGAVNKALTFEVEVSDGELLIDVTAPAATLCLNLAYIKVYNPESSEVSDVIDEGTVSKEELTKINEESSVTGVEDGVELVISNVDEQTIEKVKRFINENHKGKKYVVLDLKLVKGDEEVQPDGEITVTIPVPSQLKDAKMVQIYRMNDDGTYTEIGKVAVKDGKISFKTDHFSTYVFVEAEAGEEDIPNPYTGDSVNIFAIILIALTAGSAIVVLKKRKKVMA